MPGSLLTITSTNSISLLHAKAIRLETGLSLIINVVSSLGVARHGIFNSMAGCDTTGIGTDVTNPGDRPPRVELSLVSLVRRIPYDQGPMASS